MTVGLREIRPRGWGRGGRRLLAGAVTFPAVVVASSWWLTEPLADRGGLVGSSAAGPAVAVPEAVKAAAAGAPGAVEAPLAWPAGRLDGDPAKALLLDALLAAADRLNEVDGYTATFRKQERLRGTLAAEQTLFMKVRQKPFAVYLRFISPQAGKEVVYAEGHHENKVIAHGAGMSRLLIPRLAVPPDHPLALADSRHAITEAGLANLTARLIGYRRLDLDDPEAETVLDRVRDDEGRERLRSVHTHPRRNAERPFARVEVCYDPETFIPVEIASYDWPEPGTPDAPPLAERYRYDDLNLDAELTALDFDLANPNYSFHRY